MFSDRQIKAFAISNLEPNAIFAIRSGEIEWLSEDITQPSDEIIANEMQQVKIKLAQEEFINKVRNEVAKRILEYASERTQINMASAAAGKTLIPVQMQAFEQWVSWIKSVRLKGKELIVNNVQDFADDKHWSKPSDEAKALAEIF